MYDNRIKDVTAAIEQWRKNMVVMTAKLKSLLAELTWLKQKRAALDKGYQEALKKEAAGEKQPKFIVCH